MVAIKNLLLLVSTVTAAAISKREIYAYFNYLDSINTKCVDIVPIVYRYYGTVDQTIAVKNAQDAIYTGILQATTETTKTTGPITEEQANELLAKLDTLHPNVVAVMKSFQDKKPEFDKARTSAEVVVLITAAFESFRVLQTNTLPLVSEKYKTAAQARGDAIDEAFADTLRFYGKGV
ncbi:hypothetical protein HYFRA_00002136 [Hymenoscyphus fraxineus]|uniref:Uncharacterized protein n=1 Tax=Hymenoscyphus fraxineus TaxID=746836 RepID=A0A9N9KL66_9HELO|nr:hypothetical protein HYFRA_00002136 [Hymenoscyphus fraxineus]